MTEEQRAEWWREFGREWERLKHAPRPYRPGRCPTCQTGYDSSAMAMGCDLAHRWPDRMAPPVPRSWMAL